MKHISLGGLDVSRIGLGTMAMSGYYLDPRSSDAESIRTIQRALELGVTHIDTAEIYTLSLHDALPIRMFAELLSSTPGPPSECETRPNFVASTTSSRRPLRARPTSSSFA